MQRFTQDAQAEVQELQQQLQQEFQQRLEPVLQQVATDMGLQFVFNGPDAGLVWADAALDISAEVIKKLDSAKPPRSSPQHRRSPRVSELRPSAAQGRPSGVEAQADVLERLAHRFPSLLVDAVAEHEPGKRLVAFKNVTVNEDFFQGHFPHKPLMPAVLMIEALAQAATLLILDEVGGRQGASVQLRGVDGAKFRKHVIPGDQLKLVVTLGATRGPLVKATALAEVDGADRRRGGAAVCGPADRAHRSAGARVARPR